MTSATSAWRPETSHSLGGPQRGVVHAGLEGHQPLAACVRSAPLLADVGNGGEQLARLARVDDDAAVYDFGDLGRCPAQPVEGIGQDFFQLDGVADHVGEYRRLRAIVVALAALPSRLTEIASRATPLRGAAGAPATGLSVGDARLARARRRGQAALQINHAHPASSQVVHVAVFLAARLSQLAASIRKGLAPAGKAGGTTPGNRAGQRPSLGALRSWVTLYHSLLGDYIHSELGVA